MIYCALSSTRPDNILQIFHMVAFLSYFHFLRNTIALISDKHAQSPQPEPIVIFLMCNISPLGTAELSPTSVPEPGPGHKAIPLMSQSASADSFIVVWQQHESQCLLTFDELPLCSRWCTHYTVSFSFWTFVPWYFEKLSTGIHFSACCLLSIYNTAITNHLFTIEIFIFIPYLLPPFPYKYNNW